MKMRTGKLLGILLVLCMVLTIVPVTAFAAEVNYIDKISVTYTATEYKAGDTPQATAAVTEGNCTVAYEYWREIEQKTEGSVWTGTGRYWYSDSSKMASLAADKQITQFEAGHHYSYNIVLKTNSGYFIGDDTIVSVGEHEWGKAGFHTNLEIKETSTELRIYSPYSIDLPAASDGTSEPTAIDLIEINNVTVDFKDGDTPVFTGMVPDGADYAFRCEWWSLDENTGIISTEPEWGGGIYENKITKFEAGKVYHYGVYVTAYTADISPDAILKINGREVKYTRIGDDNDTQSFWVETELTMTPTGAAAPTLTPAPTDAPKPTDNKATASPKTGDSGAPVLWLTVALVSATAVCGVISKRKKRIK